MHFPGSDIIALVEEALPAAFGGHPIDYQFVEEEEGVVTHVSVVVSLRVGDMDEDAIVRTVLEFLGLRSRGNRMMAEHWEQGRTLRVVRREPYATPAAKIPPLRILRK
jgi:hypothetical protein